MNIAETELFRNTLSLQVQYNYILDMISIKRGNDPFSKGSREGCKKVFEIYTGISFESALTEIVKMRKDCFARCSDYKDLIDCVTILGSMAGNDELTEHIKFYVSNESQKEKRRRIRNNHAVVREMFGDKEPGFIYRGINKESYTGGYFYTFDLVTAGIFANQQGFNIKKNIEDAKAGIIHGKIIERKFRWRDILYVRENSDSQELVLLPNRVISENHRIITPRDYKQRCGF